MTTQAHHVGARDMTPEQVGMLNGRAAALQAATADLLERGYLRQTAYGRLEAWTIPPADVTPLQRAVVDAVRCRAPRLENVPAVRAALDELQRDAVRRGLLNPPRRGGKGEALKMAFMTLFGVAMAIIAATGKSVGGVVVGLGFTCFGAYNLVRAVRTTRQGRRTQARIMPLAHALESDMLGPLSADDRDRLRAALSRLDRHLAALGADGAEMEDAD